jgi:hypothetical protein
VFDPEELPRLQDEIRQATAADIHLLDEARADVRRLKPGVRRIQPHNTNAISIVASDGGNNRLEFNPYYMQLVRIVDTYGKPLLTSAVSTATDTVELSRHHLENETALGKLMQALGVRKLSQLTPMIRDRPVSSAWALVYRDLCEWAVLYELICEKDFGSHTLIVRDGLLRTKIFAGELFIRLYRAFQQAIERHKHEQRRDIFLVGIAKRSEVLERYRLVMSVEDVLPTGYPLFAPVPDEMQTKVYQWAEYVRSPDDETDGEAPKFNMGSMHFVRFGAASGDPVWTVDLLASQVDQSSTIFGALLSDAAVGFPVPLYPHSLQQADAYAHVVDLDLAVLQDTLVDAVRDQITESRRPVFDAHRLVEADPAARRYG